MIHDPLRSPSVAVVFAHALTGLGHLRVSHALYKGLPSGAHPYLLNSQDEQINIMHRLMSIHPWMRRAMEKAQYGWLEDLTTIMMRRYFRSHTVLLAQQLQTIVDEHPLKPKTLLVVATHTFLGHQIAAIKEEFSRSNWLNLILVVIVTDDSPQHIWAVGGADLIVVPSEQTKRSLERYHKTQKGMKPATYIVDPYMISPRYGAPLPDDWITRKMHSLNPEKLAPIHVSIPISGAAVQIGYFTKLIANLDRLSDRYKFHITAQHSKLTANFLQQLIGKENISLHVSQSHRDVVDQYESLLNDQCVSLEITKPSEQAFKALCSPTQRGGLIMLFSDPVGRQEYDNLNFLQRHGLLPARQEIRHLWSASLRQESPSADVLEQARHWRGVMVPSNPEHASTFIMWCLHEGIFLSMMHFSGFRHQAELSSSGVETFWKQMSNLLKSSG